MLFQLKCTGMYRALLASDTERSPVGPGNEGHVAHDGVDRVGLVHI